MALVIVANSQDCNKDVTAWGLSINAHSHQYPGIGVEGAHLAQKGKLGGSIGLSGSPIRYNRNYIRVTDGKEERGIEEYKTINFLIWGEVSYKLIQRDYKYSLHILGGATYDHYKGLPLHTGIQIRFPDGQKAYYIQAIYRIDGVVGARIGIYLP